MHRACRASADRAVSGRASADILGIAPTEPGRRRRSGPSISPNVVDAFAARTRRGVDRGAVRNFDHPQCKCELAGKEERGARRWRKQSSALPWQRIYEPEARATVSSRNPSLTLPARGRKELSVALRRRFVAAIAGRRSFAGRPFAVRRSKFAFAGRALAFRRAEATFVARRSKATLARRTESAHATGRSKSAHAARAGAMLLMAGVARVCECLVGGQRTLFIFGAGSLLERRCGAREFRSVFLPRFLAALGWIELGHLLGHGHVILRLCPYLVPFGAFRL